MWLGTELEISFGDSESPELDMAATFPSGKIALTIIAPGVLPETINIHVAKRIGGDYVILQSAGADITLPAARATVLNPLVAGALKLVNASGDAVGADRVFTILAAPSH